MTAPRDALAPLLLVHGESRFLVDTAANDWLRRAHGECGPEVAVFDAPPRLDEVRQTLVEVAMFDPARAVLVRDPPQLAERSRKGAGDATALAALVDARPPETSLCLVVHATVAASNPVLAAIRRAGGAVLHHPQPRGREVRDWLGDRLRRAGVQVDRGAVDHLLRVSGNDLGVLDSEVTKLAAFSGGGRVATRDVVALASGSEQVAVWNVVDRLLGDAPADGCAAIESLLEAGTSTQYLVATIAGQLRDMLLAHELRRLGQSPAAVARALQQPDWRAERVMRHAAQVNGDVLRDWLDVLQRIDAGTKLGEVNDAEALRAFALRVAASRLESARPARH